MATTFGERLKSARISKKLTQKELALKIGAKHNSISDWENNKNKPDPDTIELLCGVLDMSPNYLIGSSSCLSLSPAENDLIKKYRDLDDHGKEMVNLVLDKESDRCESEYIELVARSGKYKVKKEDVLKWAKQLDLDDYEEDHDLC